MYRTRFERLEQRKMFSVTDLILDPFQIESVVGDFNGDGRDDLAKSFAQTAAGDSIHLATGAAQLASIADGTSNTLMFSENVAPINVDLLGVRVDTSPIDLSVASLDVWEHAYSNSNRPAANGIIAILIGLAADPSDSRGDTAGVNGDLADGSVRRTAATLLASDEYFSRYSGTTFDDESLAATTFGRGTAALNLTHDADFETWANAAVYNRDPQQAAFYDLLISSILHEENEFSFPRMFSGGVRIG